MDVSWWNYGEVTDYVNWSEKQALSGNENIPFIKLRNIITRWTTNRWIEDKALTLFGCFFLCCQV